MAQYEIINDNKVLFKKLYDIDRNGLKRAQKKWKPIFQYTKTAMAGNKKHEIIKVAQENLYMLKRLNERTSVYNVDKWNRDYEASQYYKRSHCQYPSIDFYKTQKCSSFGNMLNNGRKNNNSKNNFYSKTQYSKNGFNYTNNITNKSKKRKKFEDFSYRDLQIGKRSKSEFGDKEEQQFKKLNEIETPQEKEVDIEQNQKNQQEQEKEEQKENEQEPKLEEQQIEENNADKENNIEIKNEQENIKEEEIIKKEEENNENNNKEEKISEEDNKKEEEIKVEKEQIKEEEDKDKE